MGTFLLILSSILFIATFGIHSMIKTSSSLEQPMYVNNSLLAAVPWISGFILPVVCWSLIFDLHWIALFFINLVVVYIFGPILTKGLLVRFASGKGLGRDMLYSFIGGIIALIIGIAIHTNSKEGNSDESYHRDTNYKYEHRTGTSNNYSYNYDVNGFDEDGNSVSGNIDMNGKYGSRTITDEDGNDIEVEVEWVGSGQLEATNGDGKTYELEVD